MDAKIVYASLCPGEKLFAQQLEELHTAREQKCGNIKNNITSIVPSYHPQKN